tara:strand:+ start:1186 stop:1440 length:255 start_codon:yes stop_codon:yes gene_type:complete
MEKTEQEVTVETKPCAICGERGKVTVPMRSYLLWCDGLLIQDAMPNTPRADREQLMTGIHGRCFDAAFYEEETSEEDYEEELGL